MSTKDSCKRVIEPKDMPELPYMAPIVFSIAVLGLIAAATRKRAALLACCGLGRTPAHVVRSSGGQ